MWAWVRTSLIAAGFFWANPLLSEALAQQAPVVQVGVRNVQVMVPERGHAIDLTHWYPAAAAADQAPLEYLGKNAVFLGTPAYRDAPVAAGRFPLVVLSHGGLRAARYMGAWVAEQLVKRGYWVLQVHAPMLKATEAQQAHREVWLRPADLTAAISATHHAPWVAEHLLDTGVGVVGFMRGATSAVQLGGGQLDPERYARLCDGDAASTGPDCAWFQNMGVGWSGADAVAVGQNHQDLRVRAVVAVAPELGQAFSEQSLARMALPVHLISLGQRESVPPYLNASQLVRNIPGVTHQALPSANVFSAFGLCTPKGVRLLKEEGEEPVLCEEVGTRSREVLHAELAALIDAALRPAMGSASR